MVLPAGVISISTLKDSIRKPGSVGVGLGVAVSVAVGEGVSVAVGDGCCVSVDFGVSLGCAADSGVGVSVGVAVAVASTVAVASVVLVGVHVGDAGSAAGVDVGARCTSSVKPQLSARIASNAMLAPIARRVRVGIATAPFAEDLGNNYSVVIAYA
jgi:hypothetical protein